MLDELERQEQAEALLQTLHLHPLELRPGEGVLLAQDKAPQPLPASLVAALGGAELEPGYVLVILVVGGHMALTAVPVKPCQAPGAC
jgi:hypothetical protein